MPTDFMVTAREAGQRLDLYLTRKHPSFSRSALGGLIKRGRVFVDENPASKAGLRLRLGSHIRIDFEPPPSIELKPEAVDFTLLYEDEYLLVLAKPPGLVVHPGSGSHGPTLAHGLLHHCGTLPGSEASRPGIVHRLDKDTSGVMVAAKTADVLRMLSQAFKDRQVHKVYQALLIRSPRENHGRVVAPIGRHPVKRQKMAVRERSGRFAATGWKVLQRYSGGLALVEARPETGRTHQIRVHMASLGCPVAGDRIYGGGSEILGHIAVSRQCLHAWQLSFIHPVSGEKCCYSSPLWDDIAAIKEQLSPLDFP